MISRIVRFILIFLIFLITLPSASAYLLRTDNDTSTVLRKVYLGGGIGLNYGGFGLQANILPIPHVRISAGYGTNLINMNYNLGLNFRMFPHKRFCPVMSYMYGYNGGIKRDDIINPGRSFKGSSLGAGLEIWNKKRVNFFQLQMLIPIKSIAFENQLGENDSDTFFKIINYNPILLSVGFHFGISGK